MRFASLLTKWVLDLGGRLRHLPEDVRAVAGLFVVAALLAAAISIVLTPPMQTPDAFVQFDRAVQVSQGGLIGQVKGQVAGGYLPAGLPGFESTFDGMVFRYPVKLTRAEFQRAARETWTNRKAFVPFAATTEYAPLAYVPGAVGVALGRLLSDRILVGYYTEELVNSLVFIALVAWAILLFRGTASLLVAAVGLLPMTIALAASPSTDGLLFGLSAVFAGIVYRRAALVGESASATTGPATPARVPWSRRVFPVQGMEWVALGALAIVGLARPPYVGLVLALGAVEASRRQLWAYLLKVVPLGALMTLVVAVWFLLGARFQGAFQAIRGTGVSPFEQVRFVFVHPGLLPHLAAQTLSLNAHFYFESFIGILGWLDTPLERWLYVGLLAGLLVLAGLHVAGAKVDLWVTLCAAVAVAVSAALLFAVLYADWTPVGAPVVVGVQGRYFLPLAPTVVLALGWDRRAAVLATVRRRAGEAIFLAMGLVSVIGSSIALVGRFWLA